MNKTHGNYSAMFKGMVALAALKNDRTIDELALEFDVSPEKIGQWKQRLIKNIDLIFTQDDDDTDINRANESDNRHAKIGQLTAENNFLSKILGR
jgi:transposase-like protein